VSPGKGIGWMKAAMDISSPIAKEPLFTREGRPSKEYDSWELALLVVSASVWEWRQIRESREAERV
jgi:hypothetical protein